MSDEQDQAEALDDDVIADDEELEPPTGGYGDDRFEHIAALDEDYPPDEPMGVDDPGRFDIEDDIASRDARREREDDE